MRTFILCLMLSGIAMIKQAHFLGFQEEYFAKFHLLLNGFLFLFCKMAKKRLFQVQLLPGNMIQLMQATLIATQSVSVNMLVSENCIEYFCLL